jgi:long-subunit acyl-CoA synthetase (AMP-forming)
LSDKLIRNLLGTGRGLASDLGLFLS